MNPKTKKSLIVGLCSVGGIVLVVGAALAAIVAYTKRSLDGLDFGDTDWLEVE